MSTIEASFVVPYVFIKKDKSIKGQNRKVMETLLVPSMIASTIMVAILTNFVPQLMPLWMSLAANQSV